MSKPSKRARALSAVLFSLMMAGLLAFGGLLLGMYLSGHFGADETDAYLFGLLLGGAMGLVGGATLLWKFWPRAARTLEKKVGG